MPITFVLALPEDFLPSSPLHPDAPIYAQVVETAPDYAVVKAIQDSSQIGYLQLSSLRSRRVTRSEASSGSGDWLRKAVVGTTRTEYVYGQVVGFRGKSLQIRGLTGDITIPVHKTEEIAPVLCLLLQGAELNPRLIPPRRLDEIHSTILDRLLEVSAPTSNRDINELLDRIVEPSQRPSPTATCTWIDPSDGSTRQFRLQHAIDYAYFVDGSRRIPRQIHLGTSFCNEPPTLDDHHQSDQPNRDHNQQSIANAITSGNSSARAQTNTQTQPPHHSNYNASLDALLTEMGEANPTRNDQQTCEGPNRKRSAPTDIVSNRQRPLPPMPTDILTAHTQTDYGQPPTNFRPRPIQRSVHDAIVADEFQGKLPSHFIQLTISSRATCFQPHLAVLRCLYDFRFGVRGLSVGHIERFDFAARRRWRRETTVHMNNFSASVNIPRPRCLSSMIDLQDALALLTAFANTFYNETTREFLLAAWNFSIALQAQGSWSAMDVDTLTIADELRNSSQQALIPVISLVRDFASQIQNS
ncbi:Hypothetical protein PHPALM_8778 [Phytophthora palmivora]|uniref:Uncharacterized protein n=1 Tax=Phytophthora palmivora TaxID=4796 RepID=A0A2P4Y913_9STRA|nr:Hypothetical protein PHPALM_8778 [Phytophthora palmivora]